MLRNEDVYERSQQDHSCIEHGRALLTTTSSGSGTNSSMKDGDSKVREGSEHGVEAEPIGESGIVVFTTSSSTNDDQCQPNRNTVVSRLLPELRSPNVGRVSRIVSEISGGQSNDEPNHRNSWQSCMQSPAPSNKSGSGPTLDQLISQLVVGVSLIFHDGLTSSGSSVIFSVLDDHSYLCVSPSEAEHKIKEMVTPPSSPKKIQHHNLFPTTMQEEVTIEEDGQDGSNNKYLPICDIVAVYVGKKHSLIFSEPVLSHINPSHCFSILTGSSASFDFEVKTVIERETITSSLSLILDEVNHGYTEIDFRPNVMRDEVLGDPSTPVPSNRTTSEAITPAENCNKTGSTSYSEYLMYRNSPSGDFHEQSMDMDDDIMLSPANRTYIYNNISGLNSRSNDEGTETTLASRSHDRYTGVDKSANKIDSLDDRAPNFPDLDPGSTISDNTQLYGDGQISNEINIYQGCTDDKESTASGDASAQWSSHYCALALQDITEVCTSLLHNINEVSKQPFCGDNGAANSYLVCIDADELETIRMHIQMSLAAILSSTSHAATTCFEGQVWSLEDTCATRKAIEAEEVGRILRNRAAVLNAQSCHLRRLRNEMTFFHAIKMSSQRMRWVATAHSMDEEIDNVSMNGNSGAKIRDRDRRHGKHHSPTTTISSTQLSLLNNLIGGPLPQKKEQEDELFYDSDPGEIKYTTRRKSSRKSIHETFNNIEEAKLWKESDCKKKRADENLDIVQSHKSDSFSDTESSEKQNEGTVSFLDDSAVFKFIKEITNEIMTVVWHPTPTIDKLNRPPICVRIWVELGSRLREIVIQPKLMWSAAYEPEIDQRKLNISEKVPNSLELLDICRILKASIINRDIYPFAKKSSCFSIETSSDVYLFEAISEAERDRVVHSLKLLVARLASQLIVGSPSVYDEFFTPGGQVPGVAPDWAVGGNDYKEPRD